MNERKVEVYFHVAFETHKFTVNLEADISHVMSRYLADLAEILHVVSPWGPNYEMDVSKFW